MLFSTKGASTRGHRLSPDDLWGRTSPPEKIFVARIPPTVTQEDLLTYFGSFGSVEQVLLKTSAGKGKPNSAFLTNYAFVTFEEATSARKALEQEQHGIGDAVIFCKPAREQEPAAPVGLGSASSAAPASLHAAPARKGLAAPGGKGYGAVRESGKGALRTVPYLKGAADWGGKEGKNGGRSVKGAPEVKVWGAKEGKGVGGTGGDAARRRVWIGGLPKTASGDGLMLIFSRYGKVANLEAFQGDDGSSRPYAFVTYVDDKSAQAAIIGSERGAIKIDGALLQCRMASPPQPGKAGAKGVMPPPVGKGGAKGLKGGAAGLGRGFGSKGTLPGRGQLATPVHYPTPVGGGPKGVAGSGKGGGPPVVPARPGRGGGSLESASAWRLALQARSNPSVKGVRPGGKIGKKGGRWQLE